MCERECVRHVGEKEPERDSVLHVCCTERDQTSGPSPPKHKHTGLQEVGAITMTQLAAAAATGDMSQPLSAATANSGSSSSSDPSVAAAPVEQLTPLGRLLALLPLEPRLGKLLVMGAALGCLAPTLVGHPATGLCCVCAAASSSQLMCVLPLSNFFHFCFAVAPLRVYYSFCPPSLASDRLLHSNTITDDSCGLQSQVALCCPAGEAR